MKRKPPRERRSVTHSVLIKDAKNPLSVHITVGLYDDEKPCEIFIKTDGDAAPFMLNPCAIAMSVALQHGAEANELAEKFAHTRFPPCGPTDNPDVPECKSLADYIGKWMLARFPNSQKQDEGQVK